VKKEVKNPMVKKSKIFGVRYLEKMTRDPALTGGKKYIRMTEPTYQVTCFTFPDMPDWVG